ncbi:MAG: hypothetical protein JWR69_1877 [Pedosphaera sp.]|nr:hypothetical protein [Pedosphaera sp.]
MAGRGIGLSDASFGPAQWDWTLLRAVRNLNAVKEMCPRNRPAQHNSLCL